MVKSKKTALLLVTLLTCVGMLLCACVPNETPDDSILAELNSNASATESRDEGNVADGEYLTILDVVSITPTNVAVFGRLTEKAIQAGVDSVRISGSMNMEVQESCVGDYFIVPVDLPGTSKATFSATAMKGEEEIGETLPFIAPYDSTAEERLDGKSVSIGRNSRMYFSKYLSDYLCKELYTASQVRSIKSSVMNTYKALISKANGAEVGMIYVFLPDVTTMDPSIMREKDIADKNEAISTRYQQVVEAVKGTKVSVVDMREVLQEQLDNGATIYDLYRRTDSHPTELTSFLMYQEVMKYISAIDEDVVPRTLEDYVQEKITVLGGDYALYRQLDPEVLAEEITILKPKFDLQSEIKSIKLYNDPANGDYTMFSTIDATDFVLGSMERALLTTYRTELPNLLIYRDENAAAATLLLADSCDQTLMARVDDYFISLTDATQYRDREEGKNVVDFIVVFVSESEIAKAFSLS